MAILLSAPRAAEVITAVSSRRFEAPNVLQL
jgi:hypothetical protein